MKRSLIYIFFIGCLGAIAFEASTKSAGTPPYTTGAPNEATCSQAGCHDGVTEKVNSGTGSCEIVFNDSNPFYDNGKTYNVKIKVAQPNCKKFGFQVVALFKQGNGPAGKVTITDTGRSQLRNYKNVTWGCCQNREWVTHTTKGNSTATTGKTEWTYSWKAPSTGNGDIIFYMASLGGDNDATDTFDYTYTTTKTITYKKEIGVGITDLDNTVVPSAYYIYEDHAIRFQNITECSSVSIYDLSGKRLFIKSVTPESLLELRQTGIYILLFEQQGNQHYQKLLVY